MNRLGLPFLILCLWILAALFGGRISGGANLIDLNMILSPPGSAGLLGFDDLGRPIFERLIAGARSSFLVAFSVVAISALLGTALGLIGGYRGGWFDLLLEDKKEGPGT